MDGINDPNTNTLSIFEWMNKLGMAHGIGRIDIVENRFVGIKSRGTITY